MIADSGTGPPQLSLVEEIVLLSIGSRSRRLRRAVRLAGRAYPSGPANYRATIAELGRRGLIARQGAFRTPAVTQAARADEQAQRAQALVRAHGPLTGRDAELLVLLAYGGSLLRLVGSDRVAAPTVRGELRHVRQRIAAIPDPASEPALDALMKALGIETADELAAVAIKSAQDVSPFSEHWPSHGHGAEGTGTLR